MSALFFCVAFANDERLGLPWLRGWAKLAAIESNLEYVSP